MCDLTHFQWLDSSIHPEMRELLPARLHGECVTNTYEKSERLFESGQRPETMFFIGSGEVVLERLGSQGTSVILQRTRHGFVDAASLQLSRYPADGLITKLSEITEVPISAIRAELKTDLAFANRWIAMLNNEDRRMKLRCEHLTLYKVGDRLLHFLETEGTGGRYVIGTGLKSLAAELGVTHEALCRTVKTLEKAESICRDTDSISLVQPVK